MFYFRRYFEHLHVRFPHFPFFSDSQWTPVTSVCACAFRFPIWLTQAGPSVQSVWKVSFWTCVECCMTAVRGMELLFLALLLLWKSESWRHLKCHVLLLNWSESSALTDCALRWPDAVSLLILSGLKNLTCSCVFAPMRHKQQERSLLLNFRDWVSTYRCLRSFLLLLQP